MSIFLVHEFYRSKILSFKGRCHSKMYHPWVYKEIVGLLDDVMLADDSLSLNKVIIRGMFHTHTYIHTCKMCRVV